MRVACAGQLKLVKKKISLSDLEGKIHLGGLEVDGRIIVKLVLIILYMKV